MKALDLIDYEGFAKLRFRDFFPELPDIAEVECWQWMGTTWRNEGVGFSSFSSHHTTPNETGGIELSLDDLPAAELARLLVTIGLPLHYGMRIDEIISELGEPSSDAGFVPDRRSYQFILGSVAKYVCYCTVLDDGGLIYLSIIRRDLFESYSNCPL